MAAGARWRIQLFSLAAVVATCCFPAADAAATAASKFKAARQRVEVVLAEQTVRPRLTQAVWDQTRCLSR